MITGNKLNSFLPQSTPMLMIDKLVSSDEESTVTNLSIKDDNIFCINGILKEAGLIENMAQTAAVRSGFEASEKNEKVKTGYIGSIKNLKIYSLPKKEQVLETIVNQKTVIGNISVIQANVNCYKTTIAECEMTIILLDSE